MTIFVEAEHALAFGDRSIVVATSNEVVPIQAQEGEPVGFFRGDGVVTAIDPFTGALTLDHEEIKGLMPAMVMMYRVNSRALSEGLHPGDKIEFGLEAQSYTIRDVKVIERAH